MSGPIAYVLFMRTASTPDGSPYLAAIRSSAGLDLDVVGRWMEASPDVRARVVEFPSGTAAHQVREAIRLLSPDERCGLYARMSR
jgi:hypothetical protein